ncbi:MAG TPA: ABC transporter ATP-binding protein [Clostridiales bacterium]|nr:ABC transporter ATP-binding protein [Clostridiales bacterium]
MPKKRMRGPGGGHGPGAIGVPGEKPKDFKGTMGKLLSYLGKYKIGVAFVILFAIGSTVFNIVGPKILGNATTEIYTGIMGKISGGEGINFENIAQILIMLISIYVIAAFFGVLQGLIMTNIAQKISYRMRKQISEKINVLPMNYFDTKLTGEVLSIITNDIDTLSMNLNQSATQIISSIATIIGILIMMFSINWIMTLVALLVLPISMVFISIIVKKSQKYFRDQQDYLGHVNGQVEETFGGINIVQAFNNQEETVKKFDKDNNTLFKSGCMSQFLSGLMMPVMQFVGNLAYVAIAVLGGYLVINGSIAVGDIQSFIQYVRSFTQPISQVAQVSNMLQSMAASAERVFNFLDEAEEDQTAVKHAMIIDGKKERKAVPQDIIGSVEFKDVHFGYNPDKIIINDFSAQVKQGQKIAIVGPTGAGKTTMVKLLMRFYDINSGEILIDNYNIKDFDRQELREVFGMVLQDTWLFSGTIMENIRYGKLDATDDEVIAAAKAAHVDNFVRTLPDGYNMVLNEEASNISQGQKQLLTIARTILADPKILILDEATSSVDTRTEVRIQKAMDNLMRGRTSFVIAHRLSTIKNADLILVMKDGDIIEQGTHDALIASGGFYCNLYNSQFENVS